MDFSEPAEYRHLRDAIRAITDKYGSAYFAERAAAHEPTTELWQDLAKHGFIGINLPDTMDLRVTQTEPTIQKATASSVMKPATLETGLVVPVPPFVNEGDKIRVDTSEARYVQRVE